MIKQRGFSAGELIVVVAVMALISVIIMSGFISFRKNQALVLDTSTIIETLRQARNQTLSSKNSSTYGVHFASSKITLFTGSTYSSGSGSNQDFILSSTDTILTISLSGGGSDVVFQKLSGETAQNGTVTVSSPSSSQTKTVTIYKTGVVE